jgi:hypothetical protein
VSSYERLPWPDRSGQEADTETLTDELRVIIAACRDRASVLYAACDGTAALAITELNGLADLLLARIAAYTAPR